MASRSERTRMERVARRPQQVAVEAVVPFVAWVALLAGCEKRDDAIRDASADSATNHDVAFRDGPAGVPKFSVSVALASDILAEAPGTVGIVKWSITDVMPESAEIWFGLDTGYGMVAPVDLDEPDFRTLLLGMKPDRTYHFRVIAKRG